MRESAGSESVDRWWLQRWCSEHSELDRLIGDLQQSLSRGSIVQASDALEQLVDALDPHFAVEEDVYFPLVEGLSSRHSLILASARLDHRKIRERMNDLWELLGNGDGQAARRALPLLLSRVRAHEIEESKLVGELEAVAET